MDPVRLYEQSVPSFSLRKAFATAKRGAFPDWHSTMEELITEEDRGMEPTGRRVAGGRRLIKEQATHSPFPMQPQAGMAQHARLWLYVRVFQRGAARERCPADVDPIDNS
jgi:hypothetical protein